MRERSANAVMREVLRVVMPPCCKDGSDEVEVPDDCLELLSALGTLLLPLLPLHVKEDKARK